VGRLVVEAPEARRFSIVTYSKVLLRAEGGALEKMWRDSRALDIKQVDEKAVAG